MHAAVTYSNVGRWYYNETANLAALVRLTFITYQVFLQAFFMGFLFFLAGYFAPPAYDRKGAGQFLRDRAIRLGLPTLFYMFVLGPLSEYLVDPSWSPSYYFQRLRFLAGTGPLWFCAALLIFCCVYAMVRSMGTGQLNNRIAPKLPSNVNVLLLIAGIGLASFLVRTVQPLGSAFYNMQLGYFSQYVVLFALGIAAYRGDWLQRLPREFGLRWVTISVVGGFAFWIALLGFGGALTGDLNHYVGGLHWQSVGLSIWESFVCAGVCLGLLVIFRERFYVQGRVAKFLSENAFCVYVFHPPILIALSLLLRPVPFHPLVKFLLLKLV
jgi:hypothetical protein